ncbi:MAG: 50S ribosomal protein L4 [Candidatus Liptonbacteria bacterium]|nr:50S ribosomal protein L4 [Candidatus Liptonbacteria bacterium]
MKATVYNLKNEKVGEMELPSSIFEAKWNPVLVAQVLRAQLANSRRPWAHAKTRAEVRGGGRKPWRQKGTGRARHGSTRSPLWVGGGKAHGPNKLRDYSQKVNKKMARLALFSALAKKLKENQLKVFEDMNIAEPKTKVLSATLKHLLNLKKDHKKMDVLMVADRENANVRRASSNLVKAKTLDAQSLNIYDVLNHKNIFVDKASVGALTKHYARKQK